MTEVLNAAPTDTAPANPAPTSTAVRARLRRSAFWIVLGALLLLITVVAAIASVGRAADLPLDPNSAAPSGSMAVVQVLREHGVKVDATDSLKATATSVDDPADTTILVFDGQKILDSAQREELAGLTDRLVFVTPSGEALEDLAPAVTPVGSLTKIDRKPGCALPAAKAAGTVHSSGIGYTVDDGSDDGASEATVTCYTTDGASGLVQTGSGPDITVLGLPDVLTNTSTLDAGNAALALNLLGEHHHLIWYLPGTADLAAANGSGQSLGDLSPDWVIPLTTLLGIAALATGVWRARRFGPLVIENLPVVVRSSETMEGRARLYERGSDRLHALDALRIATARRLAAACGLSRRSSLPEVIDAVSAATGRDRAAVAGILVDAIPHNDTELVRLSDELLRLEHDTTASLKPGE